MRTDMYNNIQDFSFSNIDKFSTAGLVTRLTTDVMNIQSAFMMIIRVAIRAPFMILFALIMAFTISARIASMYLLLIPVLGIALAALILTAKNILRRFSSSTQPESGSPGKPQRNPCSQRICP